MGGYQADVAEKAARRASGERPARSQWHLLGIRSGAPWRDLPDNFGPYTTCYNRFLRWRRAGVWAKIMSALAGAHDAAVQMIDTSIVRVHQHAACITRNRRQSMGRSRGGLTRKIHALVDTNGLPVQLALTAGIWPAGLYGAATVLRIIRVIVRAKMDATMTSRPPCPSANSGCHKQSARRPSDQNADCHERYSNQQRASSRWALPHRGRAFTRESGIAMEMAERHEPAACNRSSSLADRTSLVVGCPTLLVQAVQFT